MRHNFNSRFCFLRKDDFMATLIRMLSSLGGMFNRCDPRQDAALALARLLSQIDMEALPYDKGVQKSRRQDDTRHVAIGVWLVPLAIGLHPDDAALDKAIHAATCDLRRHGIGVLLPLELKTKALIVAVADKDDVWRFFIGDVCHQSARPGGWSHVGITIDQVWEPAQRQTIEFRHRIENAFSA